MNPNLTSHKLACTLVLCAVLIFFEAVVSAQDRAPKVVSQPVFILSNEAIAAGIDGVLGVSLKIDKTGKVTNVVIHGGPAWPCGAPEPKDQIKAVRDAVKQQLLATVFEPSMKNDKLIDVELSLQFAIGEAYKSTVRQDEAKNRPGKLIEGGVINGRALRLVKPATPPMTGMAIIRVLIDEQGNVAHAGGVTGHPQLQSLARDAACESKFSPTSLSGQPVKVTGMITYNFSR